MLSSNLEYSKLSQLASKMTWHRIERNLEQLQKREQQLRFSINNAVWLETCLLNMMDSTSIKAASQQGRSLKADGAKDLSACRKNSTEESKYQKINPNNQKSQIFIEESKPKNLLPSACMRRTETPLRPLPSKTSASIKTAVSPSNLGNLWAKIVNSTKSSNQKMLSHASLIGLDRELNFAVLAVESKYVAKFQKNVTHLSRIITHCLKQQQPIEVIIEEK